MNQLFCLLVSPLREARLETLQDKNYLLGGNMALGATEHTPTSQEKVLRVSEAGWSIETTLHPQGMWVRPHYLRTEYMLCEGHCQV